MFFFQLHDFRASRFFKLRAFSSDVSFTSHLHLRVIVDAQLMRGNPRRTVIGLFSRVSEYQFKNDIHPTLFYGTHSRSKMIGYPFQDIVSSLDVSTIRHSCLARNSPSVYAAV